MFTNMPDSVALVSAFLTGVTVLVFGCAAFHYIRGAIKQYRNANRHQAVRNHK